MRSAKANRDWFSFSRFSILEDAHPDRRGASARPLSALLNQMYIFGTGQTWLNCLWSMPSRQQRPACVGAGRLVRPRSLRPAWMLFHPSLWLLQTQLSLPNDQIAGCKLARFGVQINRRDCLQQSPSSGEKPNHNNYSKPIFSSYTDVQPSKNQRGRQGGHVYPLSLCKFQVVLWVLTV